MNRSYSESTPDYRYAALHGEWNLIRTVEQSKLGAAEYLFHLPSDPAEANDVRDANPAKARELAAALDQRLTLHPDGDSPHPGWIPPGGFSTGA